jgi:hypothetical protein
MSHTYEVMVDMKEFANQNFCTRTTRYEIDAETRQTADHAARGQARLDFPSAAEYDIRVTRLLK